MIYRKYLFPAGAVPDIQAEAVVILGHPVLTEATEELPATYDTAHVAVDALVYDPVPLEAFEVWPESPKHHFAGWDDWYQAERLKRI